jgi:hypothetical protein
MTDKNEGGSAFPIAPNIDGFFYPGMSLRNWFAGQALAAGAPLMITDRSCTSEEVAVDMYRIADAMIAERGK